LCTNDLQKFKDDQTKVSLSTAFLDANGRIIAEALLNKPHVYSSGKKEIKENEIWIDCDKLLIDDLLKHIKKFTFRKNLYLQDISEQLKIWSIISPYLAPDPSNCGKIWQSAEHDEEQALEDEGDYCDFGFVDPRLPQLGARIITSAAEERFDVDKEYVDEVATQKTYDKVRMMYGIGEGVELMSCLPFTANFDFLNALDFSKGRYIGQELTARSYHTGIIRKRIMPFVVHTPNIKVPESLLANVTLDFYDEKFTTDLSNKVIKNSIGLNIGKILGSINNVGIAIVSVLKLEKDEDFMGQIGDHNCTILQNNWFQEKHDQYLESVKARDPSLLEDL